MTAAPSFLDSPVGGWLTTTGLHIAMVLVFAALCTRLIRWVATRVSRRIAETDDRDPVVRSETVKHRQAVASVISSVTIAVLYTVVAVDITNELGLPAPSASSPTC